MHWRVLAIFTAILLTLTEYIDCLPVAKAKQLIPSHPGLIPVYIRPGDIPLEDINPELAAAFDSYATKHNRIIYGRSIKELSHDDKDISLVNIDDDDDLSLDNEDSTTAKTAVATSSEKSQHIQKIPRH
ncbi:unnamed protein product [Brassicogethes aeneus]|uniref:Uncharacterized protein n=1 Tax=Brassicogethes aeneus TaxID=1431903 RepID=A0A9P0FMS6_BRAAE|nr:unnamed protein product [Brassicogethes aeneus]